MLVLTRRLMEKLYIGGDICVTVVRLEGGQVRLGIDAPKHVPVVRAELLPRQDPGRLPPSRTDSEADIPATAVKIPPSWARGTDSRHRGRSR
jgi:carbon storage regulator